jgi:hypothetical protein
MEADPPPLTSENEEGTKGVDSAVADSKKAVDAPENIDTETSTVATTAATSVASEDAIVEGPVPPMTTSAEPEPENVVPTPTPVVETVTGQVAPPTVVVQTATTSTSSKQLQQQEHLQQSLNMAKDWAASDIEKKLSENSALLSQWSLILDKNGSCDVSYKSNNFQYFLLSIYQKALAR